MALITFAIIFGTASLATMVEDFRAGAYMGLFTCVCLTLANINPLIN